MRWSGRNLSISAYPIGSLPAALGLRLERARAMRPASARVSAKNCILFPRLKAFFSEDCTGFPLPELPHRAALRGRLRPKKRACLGGLFRMKARKASVALILGVLSQAGSAIGPNGALLKDVDSCAWESEANEEAFLRAVLFAAYVMTERHQVARDAHSKTRLLGAPPKKGASPALPSSIPRARF